MQGGESDTSIMDSTNIKWEGGESNGENAVMQCDESEINVMDSATKEQWEGGETMGREEGWEQSPGEAEEGLTPYVFLTLEELQNLRKIIKKSLRELDDQDRE